MQKRPRKKNLTILVCLLVVLVLGFMASGYLQFNHERSRFDQLNADLDGFSGMITKKDAALEITKKKYCRHDVEEFGGGRLSCGVDLVFSPVTPVEVIELQNDILFALDSTGEGVFSKSGASQPDFSIDAQTIFGLTDVKTGIGCGFRRSIIDRETADDYRIKVTLSCTKHVSRRVY